MWRLSQKQLIKSINDNSEGPIIYVTVALVVRHLLLYLHSVVDKFPFSGRSKANAQQGCRRALTASNYLYLDNNNNELLWDSIIAEVVNGNTHCFVWQDNKPVVAMMLSQLLIASTGQKIGFTSENPAFKDLPFKVLIPKAINGYSLHPQGWR
jgi:hypothetical protein